MDGILEQLTAAILGLTEEVRAVRVLLEQLVEPTPGGPEPGALTIDLLREEPGMPDLIVFKPRCVESDPDSVRCKFQLQIGDGEPTAHEMTLSELAQFEAKGPQDATVRVFDYFEQDDAGNWSSEPRQAQRVLSDQFPPEPGALQIDLLREEIEPAAPPTP